MRYSKGLAIIGSMSFVLVLIWGCARPERHGRSETEVAMMAAERVVFDFSAVKASEGWEIVNDTVMGGRSQASVRVEDGLLVFAGEVSLGNGGGFASVRSRAERRDLSNFDGLLVTLRGDGQRYALTVQTDVRVPAGSYRVEFDSPQEEATLFFAFDNFMLTSFGRPVAGAPRLKPGEVRSIGFLIGSGQAGPFRLEVTQIAAVRRGA